MLNRNFVVKTLTASAQALARKSEKQKGAKGSDKGKGKKSAENGITDATFA